MFILFSSVFCVSLILEAIQLGVRQLALREHPHLILAIEDFYFEHLEEPLRQWLYQTYLKTHPALSKMSSTEVLQALEKKKGEGEEHPVLTLSREWLKHLLPFVLQKVNRVHYGLLRQKDVMDLQARGYPPTGTRLQTAVPFTGRREKRERREKERGKNPCISMYIYIYIYMK